MVSSESDLLWPWFTLWDYVFPFWDFQTGYGLLGLLFIVGAVVLFFKVVINRQVDSFAFLAAWLVIFGALVAFQYVIILFDGGSSHLSNDYYAFQAIYIFAGYSMRTTGVLFVANIIVFFGKPYPERITGYIVGPILSVLLSLSFAIFGVAMLLEKIL